MCVVKPKNYVGMALEQCVGLDPHVNMGWDLITYLGDETHKNVGTDPGMIMGRDLYS